MAAGHVVILVRGILVVVILVRGRQGRYAPHPGIELEAIPVANQHGLKKLLAVGWRKLLLLPRTVEVGAVPC